MHPPVDASVFKPMPVTSGDMGGYVHPSEYLKPK